MIYNSEDNILYGMEEDENGNEFWFVVSSEGCFHANDLYNPDNQIVEWVVQTDCHHFTKAIKLFLGEGNNAYEPDIKTISERLKEDAVMNRKLVNAMGISIAKATREKLERDIGIDDVHRTD